MLGPKLPELTIRNLELKFLQSNFLESQRDQEDFERRRSIIEDTKRNNNETKKTYINVADIEKHFPFILSQVSDLNNFLKSVTFYNKLQNIKIFHAEKKKDKKKKRKIKKLLANQDEKKNN